MDHLRLLPRHRHSRWLPGHQRPVTQGVFPVCEFMHGFSSRPQKSLAIIRPLAEAGFIVPAPHFSNLSGQDVYNGNQSKDVSEVITRTLALNTADTPLAGHINTAVGVGASGHSMGGMTTHGLLTSWPDARITAAIPMSCVDMGNPIPAVRAKVLFTHGDRDGTCPISSARQAYRELPVAKAFRTFRGAGHSNHFGDYRAVDTFVDWMRWSLYGDTAARDRLRADATSSTTTWESALS
ncbi:poly(ethylene terephthalate) hydrolase family protein [Streptomyces sp. NY05-11A]|uniref:poly(ethylene terephthalate) hydrolase family protein n=1 Tax=Streptomyces soliscabiei TaxID=588897 RepID=UPI0029AEDB37|nr:alpha/beta hydrolase [Streptomyces sp. NY05-11A]MDX2675064.1 alpha/beta hydrolase [Streptomyces sp. NY05-11A]